MADRWRTGASSVTIVKLLTQYVVSGDSWVPTNDSPPWWWGYQSFMTGSKWVATFSIAEFSYFDGVNLDTVRAAPPSLGREGLPQRHVLF